MGQLQGSGADIFCAQRQQTFLLSFYTMALSDYRLQSHIEDALPLARNNTCHPPHILDLKTAKTPLLVLFLPERLYAAAYFHQDKMLT